jgi:hypothetical protein
MTDTDLARAAADEDEVGASSILTALEGLRAAAAADEGTDAAADEGTDAAADEGTAAAADEGTAAAAAADEDLGTGVGCELDAAAAAEGLGGGDEGRMGAAIAVDGEGLEGETGVVPSNRRLTMPGRASVNRMAAPTLPRGMAFALAAAGAAEGALVVGGSRSSPGGAFLNPEG